MIFLLVLVTECKNTKPIIEELDIPCPMCNSKIVLRKSRKGKKFYGCSNYPECEFVSWFEPVDKKCPLCGSFMVKRQNKSQGEYIECSNKECKFKIKE